MHAMYKKKEPASPQYPELRLNCLKRDCSQSRRLPLTLQNNFFSFKGNKHVNTVSCAQPFSHHYSYLEMGALGLWVYAGYELGRGNGIGSPIPLLWMILFEPSHHETVF